MQNSPRARRPADAGHPDSVRGAPRAASSSQASTVIFPSQVVNRASRARANGWRDSDAQAR
eukprot:506557-Pyramimonas_sp.AAC.1